MANITSTILGIVVDCGEEVKVYNYTQHKLYSLSKEQYSKVAGTVGTFPIVLFAAPRYSENDVVIYNAQLCYVKGGKLIDIQTGKRVPVSPVFAAKNATRRPRPFQTLCNIIKQCCSYEDVVSGRIDLQIRTAAEISNTYPSNYSMVKALLDMYDKSTSRITGFNYDWYKACNSALTYLQVHDELPVMSLDVLKH